MRIDHGLLHRLWNWSKVQRAEDIVAYIKEFLEPKRSIIDIGAGCCHVSNILLRNGYHVSPVDIADNSWTPDVSPVIYDGRHLPYADDTFDIALLLAVLHHTPNPDLVLLEAKRVAKNVIILEDIYRDTVNRYVTYWSDSIGNLEFRGHPHTNKTDRDWRKTFERLGFSLLARKYRRSYWVFSHGVYVLEG